LNLLPIFNDQSVLSPRIIAKPIMKKKPILFKAKLVLLILIFVGCCKEEPPVVVDPLFGDWQIIKADSGLFSVRRSLWKIEDSINVTGNIVFEKDSTGYFYDLSRSLNKNEDHFLYKRGYSHYEVDSQYHMIDIIFRNGTASQSLYEIYSQDSINLYFRYYPPLGGHGEAVPYYRFYLKRMQ